MNIFGKSPKTFKLDLEDPFKLFKQLYHSNDSVFLLESMESDTGLSRYSFIGFDPILTIRAKSNILEIETKDNKEKIRAKNPFNIIRNFLKEKNNFKGFAGGLVGYISYESARFLDKIPIKKPDFPDFEFGLFLDGIKFNHLTGKCTYITLSENRLDHIKEASKDNPQDQNKLSFKDKGRIFSKDQYEEMVLRTKERINKGEIFQAVISNAHNYKIKGDKLHFYEALRKVNPSPYMYHLKLGEREIIGSSPEMLVRVENRAVETFPIAGTRPRGSNEKEDKKIAAELLSDEKELAEHLMLVDLARNDIGKISKYGSVKVKEYMSIKKFSHVQHILSHVKGELRKDKTAIDALSSVFPAGTVTGAPKIRAMEVIDEIETTPRGAYAGALGYFSLNGNADFAITIRSLITQGTQGKIQAGAGIVYDSIPEKEFLECENKAKALLYSLKMAGEER
ncbi:MAG TPA: anthranilate synthase component I [Methanobacteriales archaeon]|nr:anthranilate synthase component I [Methanobacteriaceae archaeon]HIH61496.1 anthranilate synthase component I [Methanobacteriales archaeon]